MDSFKNYSSKMNNSTNSSNSKTSTILRIIYISLIILFILFVIYTIVSYYNYSQAVCYEKKSFFDYLFSTDSNVCYIYTKPVPSTISKIRKDISKEMSDIQKDLTKDASSIKGDISKDISSFDSDVKKDVNYIETDVKKDVTKIKDIFKKKEVFHIANQDYSYDQSKCKCASYGARLATKDEVTNAYNSGANWCSYGWSEGQNAYYPVQKCYYDSIMEEDGFLENSDKYCGKPGLNGGYFSNPQLKFGVNCYGVKPNGSVVKPMSPYCAPKNFCSLSKNSYANQKLSTDEIAPFNNDKWNI